MKFDRRRGRGHHPVVAPRVGVGIEMSLKNRQRLAEQVAPHAGAWIEIYRQCGAQQSAPVAPHVGAWIEMGSSDIRAGDGAVAPRAGEWGGILAATVLQQICRSSPAQTCGSKFSAPERCCLRWRSSPRGCRGQEMAGDTRRRGCSRAPHGRERENSDCDAILGRRQLLRPVAAARSEILVRRGGEPASDSLRVGRQKMIAPSPPLHP